VATGKGEHPIGSLHVGDKVWAYNPTTHKMELESVLHVWIHQDNDLVDLTVTTTTKAQHGSRSTITMTREVIHTNKKHPFFTIEQGFLAVSKITLGMHLLRADGRVGKVTGWKVVPGTKVMYNLEVQQDHTFTVGVGMWVVHNSDMCGGDQTPGGRTFSDYSANRANTRGFTKQNIDDIINNNANTRVRQTDYNPDTGTVQVRWRYQDSRGNVVITDEWGDTIITVYGYHPNTGEGNYIPKP